MLSYILVCFAVTSVTVLASGDPAAPFVPRAPLLYGPAASPVPRVAKAVTAFPPPPALAAPVAPLHPVIAAAPAYAAPASKIGAPAHFAPLAAPPPVAYAAAPAPVPTNLITSYSYQSHINHAVPAGVFPAPGPPGAPAVYAVPAVSTPLLAASAPLAKVSPVPLAHVSPAPLPYAPVARYPAPVAGIAAPYRYV
ncbi:lysine-rich arabinogalactan protein 19-like [Varroa jacobsoni]|uniref:Uncharacterized protein n=1 Tax=Varroa destructor TaxID=109461 RepID=A0A7M7JZC2_VARDE|nr:lysine-rich arabinogalactan protein 19-like [Varroa destructor]XP_022709615.1 lysine-rich arabinogalactan protein 19-like [Varroa jacobsoni]